MDERLARTIEDRTDDLTALAADLIRFPTVNPPGDAYRPCVEYIGDRLRKRGFGVEFIRAEGVALGAEQRARALQAAQSEIASLPA